MKFFIPQPSPLISTVLPTALAEATCALREFKKG